MENQLVVAPPATENPEVFSELSADIVGNIRSMVQLNLGQQLWIHIWKKEKIKNIQALKFMFKVDIDLNIEA